MTRRSFSLSMSRDEKIFGWVYTVLHIFFLRHLLTYMNKYVFTALGFTLSDTYLELVYYALGVLLLAICLSHYYKSSFKELWANKLKSLTSLLLALVFFCAGTYAVGLLISLIAGGGADPNETAVKALTAIEPGTTLIISVLLAPIVEETLFRGVIFGTIKSKNVAVGYIVSSLLFAAYHLMSYFIATVGGGFEWRILLMLLQYLPAGLVLCWCYARSRNIWTPILLHMIINYVSILIKMR